MVLQPLKYYIIKFYKSVLGYVCVPKFYVCLRACNVLFIDTVQVTAALL